MFAIAGFPKLDPETVPGRPGVQDAPSCLLSRPTVQTWRQTGP